MKVLESDNDGFEFERAYIREIDGVRVPIAVMGGVECGIETKPSLLAAGIAFCEPLDPALAECWPMSVIIETDDAAGPRRVWNLTTDPRVLSAAIKFSDHPGEN